MTSTADALGPREPVTVPLMEPAELDDVYTLMCRELSEAHDPLLYLSRLALLFAGRVDSDTALALVRAARVPSGVGTVAVPAR